jgi:uncharacterized protein (TIGR02453 family)
MEWLRPDGPVAGGGPRDKEEKEGEMAALAQAMFSGFGRGAAGFFEGLERDNSRAYFEARRSVWEEEVRGPLERLLGELSRVFGGEVKLFLQLRDERFSRDRSPYKTTTYGVIHARPDRFSGLYVEISARGLHAASGYHEMEADQLDRFRRAVDDARTGSTLGAALEAVEGAGLVVEGERLLSVPRGYRMDHPRAGLLRRKTLVAGDRFLPGAALGGREALEWVARTWTAAEPLCAWLDEHVGDSEIPPAVRWGGGRARR